MTAFLAAYAVVVTLVLAAFVQSYRARCRTVARQSELIELFGRWLSIPPITGKIADIPQLIERFSSPRIQWDVQYGASPDVPHGCVRLIVQRHKESPVETQDCTFCGDVELEGGCRVCGR